MKEIKRIHPLSSAKLVGLIMLFVGFVRSIGVLINYYTNPANTNLPQVNVVYLAIYLLLTPILLFVGGLILGFVFSLVYNFFTKIFGGLKIELTEG